MEFDLLKLLDQQIEQHSAPLEAVGNLKDYDKDKLKEIQCNLLDLLAMRHQFLLVIYEREVEIGHATAENVSVLVMTKTKFNEILSSGEKKHWAKTDRSSWLKMNTNGMQSKTTS